MINRNEWYRIVTQVSYNYEREEKTTIKSFFRMHISDPFGEGIFEGTDSKKEVLK